MEGKILPLHDKIKALRTEKGWTQGELAIKLGSDARMISQYEKGKSTPSVEYVIKFAEIFDVSIDYLLVENAPRINLNQSIDRKLIESLGEIDKLSEDDRNSIIHIIKSLVTQNKVKDLINKAS